ncbi:GNAT family N-acetyltransferase [Janthinobacterium sp. RB2R34]|uniref:GNAT family N-acetyltransferase n=1 Tax=Janthinobacterium sp. RB2R34 TaxID=3424193 RepID=UPI003F25A2E8
MDAPDLPVARFDLGDYILRRIEARDIGQIFAGLSHPDVIAHYGVSYDSLDATTEQMLWYEQLLAEGTGIWWGIARREDDALIGACGLNDWLPAHRRIDLGYWLLPQYWGRGIMRTALPPILQHAFMRMNIHRVHADVEPDNLASANLLRTLGFVHEGTLRDVECKNGGHVSLHQFSLLATDPAAMNLGKNMAAKYR